jgi:uncharacterized OB-fold protein
MPILEKVDRLSDARAWYGDIPIGSLYTAGLAGERFLRSLKDESKIMATHCETCDFTYLPPALFCERCFSELTDWVEVGPEGEVMSYTVLTVAPDGSPLDSPTVVAFVQPDGADGGLIHYLGDIADLDDDEIDIGLRVIPVFKPAAERQGSILDISHFKPA